MELYLVINFNAIFKAQEAWKHELGSVADGIDGGVFDDQALVISEHCFKGHDDPSQIAVIVHIVLHKQPYLKSLVPE